MKTISEWEVVDHGVEHPQHFSGCGAYGTEFDEVVTGCGETFNAVTLPRPGTRPAAH